MYTFSYLEPVCCSMSSSNCCFLTFYDYTVEVTNRFKGLDLIDIVPEELCTKVHDIVEETGVKTMPKRSKCKKAKWLSEEALQIAVKEEKKKVKEKRKDVRI